jgi:hypothetical protein
MSILVLVFFYTSVRNSHYCWTYSFYKENSMNRERNMSDGVKNSLANLIPWITENDVKKMAALGLTKWELIAEANHCHRELTRIGFTKVEIAAMVTYANKMLATIATNNTIMAEIEEIRAQLPLLPRSHSIKQAYLNLNLQGYLNVLKKLAFETDRPDFQEIANLFASLLLYRDQNMLD